MGNKQAQGRTTARRAAAFLAALGVLVMSSGIALMVTATPANATADPKIVVCKYVSTPGGVLQGGGNPIEVSINSLSQVVDAAWLANPTFPKAWTDAQGQGGGSVAIGYAGTGLGISDCPGYQAPPALDATASVSVTDPSCANENTPSYDVSATHATWQVLSANVVPGGSVSVKFTADAGHEFADASTEKTITESFGPAAENCGVEGPRVLTPQAPSFTEPTCTTDPGVTLPSAPQLSRTAAGLPPSVVVGGIRYTATGNVVPGGTVTVDATLVDPQNTTFGDSVTHWSHTFTTPTGCSTQVSPPTTQVSPPTTQVESHVVVDAPKTKTKSTKAKAVTPTVVEAGLVSTSAQDLRGEQGLALMVTGMALLVAAGGLGLRIRSAAARN